MRAVPAAMTAAWKAQAKTGDQRPIVRATIQKAWHNKFEYDTALAEGGDWETDRHRRGVFSSVIFGDTSPVRELRNIKNYTWTRSLEQDVATCQITLQNGATLPMGEQAEEDYDRPGFYTPNRGEDPANPWGQEESPGWRQMIVPDRLVRTYEGYGIDPTKHPAHDPNLVPSGVWLIDKVTYGSDGTIVIDMRDIGRVLLDQIVFPPVVPYAEYPLTWEKIATRKVTGRDVNGGAWGLPKGKASSSNELYVGKGLTNLPHDHYVTANGSVHGHHANHALAELDKEWWQSTGQDTPNSKVWWQVDLNAPTHLNGIRIHPVGGPYRIYISLKTANGWFGKRKIPYTVTTGDVDIKAGVPFVHSVLADKHNAFDVPLKRRYRNVTAVRLTFTRLQDTNVGEHPFKAALRDVKLYTAENAADLVFKKTDNLLKVVGNYRDYTDIVKWICAWGGFYWPGQYTGMDFIQTSNDSQESGRTYFHYADWDTVLPKGRVWGDFMQVRTAGVAKLSFDLFDKQPLMDVINYVRDATGFLFFIDETGGVIWRLPNLGLNVAEPKLGNYLSPANLGQHVRARTSEIVTIDDEETLLDYKATLDSGSIRERVFVANTTGKTGTAIKGFNPQPSGLRRIAGWTDQHFADMTEVRVMADLIAAQQMFTYRRGTVSIPGYPKIQIDDQILLRERVTSETYHHYVLGITSTLDMEEGTWTYDLDTHWLGKSPTDGWVVKPEQLDGVTRAYLNAIF